MLEVFGFKIDPEGLDAAAQASLLRDIRAILDTAPFYTPVMPRTGQPYSARMTNCGTLGWVSDRVGYRYQARHPETGAPWPALPPSFLALWDRYAPGAAAPEAALINYYGEGAKLGLHADTTEEDEACPVISLSLGDTAVFRMGGLKRKDPTRSLRLASGAVVVMGGPVRHAFHGVDRVLAGSSRLLPEGGRISVTLRRVTRA